MLRRSRWSGAALSAGLLAAVTAGYMAWPAAAQTAPATAASEPSVNLTLRQQAGDFLHYSLVNNEELANANAEALIKSGAKPEDLVAAFEAAANGRNPREIMLQDQKRPALKDKAAQLMEQLDEGYRRVARDPVRIRADVERLANGPRAYANAREHLIGAGQFAAPIFIKYLQDASKKELHPYIVQVMGEIGRPLLLPLLEELRTPDLTVKISLVNVIGKIGYPQALPRLREIASDSATAGELQRAVLEAIAAIDRTGTADKMSATDLYLKAAENYYLHKPSYQPLQRDEKSNPVWLFDAGLDDVQPVQVPTVVWNDLMTIRLTESALKGDANNGAAISLWLAATLRREIELPAGATDLPRDPNAPDGAFYARAAGPIYVNPVLARALEAHDAALALKAIDALESTGGVSGLVSEAGAPLVQALSYPDRSVRFRAAFALAKANPVSQYPSYFRVVPILAEAVSSTGSMTALVVSGNEDARNRLAEVLRTGAGHFTVFAGSSLSEAVSASQRAPGVDLVIVPDADGLARVSELGRGDYRLAGVPVLIAAPAEQVGALKVQVGQAKGVGVVDVKADDEAIRAALAAAQKDVGNVPLSEDQAKAYGLRALELLGMLASDHRSIYTVSDGIPALIGALRDKRPEIVTAAVGVAGKLNSAECEQALAQNATAAGADSAVRAMYFNGLAESAMRTGNQLDGTAVNAIINTVLTDTDAKVRLAAATALGALNVPSNQASVLILKQAK